MDFIKAIETATGLRAHVQFLDMQQGDVPITFADTKLLFPLTGYRPATPLSEGVAAFIAWYRAYFGPNRCRLRRGPNTVTRNGRGSPAVAESIATAIRSGRNRPSARPPATRHEQPPPT